MPDVQFRPRKDDDPHIGGTGAYVLERAGQIVATGGIMLHYNNPFADLFMKVDKDCRENGLGSYLLQELKRACYHQGRVPAARCSVFNKVSKATLLKAGFILPGTVKGYAFARNCAGVLPVMRLKAV